MNLFRNDNTEGYTQDQLEELNNEWQEKVEETLIEEHTDEYDFQAKCFADAVSRR